MPSFTGHAGELTVSYNSGADLTNFRMDTDGDGSADILIQATGSHASFDAFYL